MKLSIVQQQAIEARMVLIVVSRIRPPVSRFSVH